MPTYEYRCDGCGHEFEQFQSISAGALRKCPQCGRMKLKRLVSTGAGVIFKGSGFYETDYRSENYKKAAEAEKKAASGDSDGDSKTKADNGKSTDAKTADTKAGEGKKSETTPEKKKPAGESKE